MAIPDRYQEAPMEEHMDRGLGVFGRKKDEGRNDQDAQYGTQSKPYAEKGSGNYGQESAGAYNQAQPTNHQNTHGGAYGGDGKRIGLFGKKKDEGRHDQDAQYGTQSKPYSEKGSGNYGQESGGEFNKAPPTYNQNTHGGAYGGDGKRCDQDAQYETQSKPSAQQGIGSYGQESAGGFNQAPPTYNQNTGGGAYGEEGKRNSGFNQAPPTYNQNTGGGGGAYGEEGKRNGCSSEGQGGRVREEGQGEGGMQKKGLKEKIMEKLPGQQENKREGEMQGNY